MNGKEASKFVGITYRQMRYFVDQIDALTKKETSQGHDHEFTFKDLVYLKLASVMRSDGMRLDEINKAIRPLDEYWINENPIDAGTLLKIYLDDRDQYYWTWSPNFDEKFDVSMVRLPKYLYNVEYYASKLAKDDQLAFEFANAERRVFEGILNRLN